MKKLLTLVLFTTIFISCSREPATPAFNNEILWDTWGIPHIYAKSSFDLYKMAGWSQMKNHGNLILKLYGEARGKSAEYWGNGIERDRLLHTLGLVENSKTAYDNLPQEEKEIIDAFAEGVNMYAEKNPDQLDENVKVVLPVTPEDIMAHSYRVFYLEFLINRELQNLKNSDIGSNGWAANGSKTKENNALLLANPHLPWFDFWMFFETQLITPENNLYGATLVGLPTIGIGFNETLGWTHTVNTLDNVDFYQLKVSENEYAIDGVPKTLAIDTLTLKVKGEEGFTEETIIRKKSEHGIIIKEIGETAIAIRFPNMDGSLNIYKQWNAMGQASQLDEFKEALAINTIPLFNTIYADKEGNIMHHFSGNVPKKKGDWGKWKKPVSGDSSQYIWTEFYEYDEVPSIINPETNWLQNANDPPFTNTLPTVLDPAQFSSHIAPNHMSFRPQRSARLMSEATDLTLESFIALKHDTHSELALRLKDDIAKLTSLTEDSLTLAALDVLNNWDGTFDPQSKGTLLFINFIQSLSGGNMNQMFEQPWSFADPINTPDGFANAEKVLVTLKATAAGQLEQLKSLEVSYGDVFRTKVGDYDFPANGGFGHLGLFRTLAFQPQADGKYYAFHGDSYVCAMEFGETITAKALLSYGNATQPGNPHVGDQLELFNKKELRKVWYERKDQESNLELLETMDSF